MSSQRDTTATETRPPANSTTLTRDRVIVTVAALIWIAGTALGSGWFGGGGVSEQGGGLFSDDATLIAPMGPAFSIWLVIYVGLIGYVVWQWLPGSAESNWARRTRLPAAAAIALNGIWLAVVHAGWVGISVLVMLGLVVALGLVLRRTATLEPERWPAQVWIAATFGLYLGWICVATAANIASWLVGLGVAAASPLATGLTIAVLIAVLALTAFLLSRTRQPVFRAALSAAVAWGTAWAAAGRLAGDLLNRPVGITAGIIALVVIVLGALFVARQPRSLPEKASTGRRARFRRAR